MNFYINIFYNVFIIEDIFDESNENNEENEKWINGFEVDEGSEEDGRRMMWRIERLELLVLNAVLLLLQVNNCYIFN